MVLFLGFSIHRNCRSDAEGWTADLENYKYEIPRKNPGNVLEKVSGKVQITQSKKKIDKKCMGNFEILHVTWSYQDIFVSGQ